MSRVKNRCRQRDIKFATRRAAGFVTLAAVANGRASVPVLTRCTTGNKDLRPDTAGGNILQP